MTKKVLLIEDNEVLSRAIEVALVQDGFAVDSVGTGEKSLTYINSKKHDIILLDLILPEMSGEDVMKYAKKVSDIPIIIITSINSEIEKLFFFQLGIDDYIVKPFSVKELVARVHAVTKRYQIKMKTKTQKNVKNLTLNYKNHVIYDDGKPIKLQQKEFLVIDLFFSNPNIIITKEMIYKHVWHDDYIDDFNVINVLISKVRKKIEKDPSNPQFIKTVHGLGYILEFSEE